jgi:DNA-binding GntR family transcriptional regulator
MALVNTDIAYKFIRERILNGTYAAGIPLASKNLSKEVGVSRTPVRDALRQLEADGLVIIKPRIGASVRSMDLQEFKDLCGLRQALEMYTAGLAAQNRTEEELREIRSALEAMREIVEKMIKASSDKELLGDLAREDVRFHLAIINVAKNELIKKEIMRLSLINRVVSTWPKTKTAESLSDRRKVLESHQEIFDAIAKRDVILAKGAMERHLRENLEKVIQLMGVKEQSRFHSELGLAS